MFYKFPRPPITHWLHACRWHNSQLTLSDQIILKKYSCVTRSHVITCHVITWSNYRITKYTACYGFQWCVRLCSSVSPPVIPSICPSIFSNITRLVPVDRGRPFEQTFYQQRLWAPSATRLGQTNLFDVCMKYRCLPACLPVCRHENRGISSVCR